MSDTQNTISKYLLPRNVDLGTGLSIGGPPGVPIEMATPETKVHRLRLQVRSSTDTDWFTINTADARLGAKEKLRSMWYNGYSTMYPSGTEWRIVDDWF